MKIGYSARFGESVESHAFLTVSGHIRGHDFDNSHRRQSQSFFALEIRDRYETEKAEFEEIFRQFISSVEGLCGFVVDWSAAFGDYGVVMSVLGGGGFGLLSSDFVLSARDKYRRIYKTVEP